MTRRDEQQTQLASAISEALRRDGFTIKPTRVESGYPVFGVVRAQAGVAGAMKNLIFASIGEKPELIFRDALNNDVERIVKHAMAAGEYGWSKSVWNGRKVESARCGNRPWYRHLPRKMSVPDTVKRFDEMACRYRQSPQPALFRDEVEVASRGLGALVRWWGALRGPPSDPIQCGRPV